MVTQGGSGKTTISFSAGASAGGSFQSIKTETHDLGGKKNGKPVAGKKNSDGTALSLPRDTSVGAPCLRCTRS
jgi:hypothetical protein